MHANYLDTLDWGILIAYFLILIGIGICMGHRTKRFFQWSGKMGERF